MIYILNKLPRLNRGHHWIVDGYIRRCFREIKAQYVYINPMASKALLEDHLINSLNFRYINTSNKDKYVSDAIEFILKDLKVNDSEQKSILITWLPQFSHDELTEIFNAASEIGAKIIGVSLPTQDALIGKKIKYRYEHEAFFPKGKNNILWVGEEIASSNNSLSNVRQMPEYAEITEITNTKRNYHLSFFGQLSSYRGMSEILIISLLNPRMKVRIKGYGFSQHRTLRPIRYRFFRYRDWKTNPLLSLIFSLMSMPIALLRNLPNVSFSNVPFEEEYDLDVAMHQTNAIFYGAKLPHGSGIISKSLSGGIPVIWMGWEGQAFNFLKLNYPQGQIKFIDILIPNRVIKKIDKLQGTFPIKENMWKVFRSEIKCVFSQ